MWEDVVVCVGETRKWELPHMQANFADKTIGRGDNLDILRGMNSESVDLIYLDPPFNSNRNYSAPVGSAAAGLLSRIHGRFRTWMWLGWG